MVSMVVLSPELTARLLWKEQFADARLNPLKLASGDYAFPGTVLTDPRHTRWRSILKQGTVVDSATLTIASVVTSTGTFDIPVNGTTMFLYFGADAPTFGYPAPILFDIPATNLYRFEGRRNNDHTSHDRLNNRRRIELMQYDAGSYVSGDTVWAAWATVLTDQRAGMLEQQNGTIIHQWHPNYASSAPGPLLDVNFGNRQLGISTRSSADGGTFHQRYTTRFEPTTGVPTYFVLQGTLGSSGHLNAWINGTKVVNMDLPLGFYAEGFSNLAHVQTGIYMDNTTTTDVLYHANIEFGLTSLSARIATPLTVPTPPDGWGPAVLYPAPTQLTGVTYSQSTVYASNSAASYTNMNNGTADGSANGNETGTQSGSNPWVQADCGSTRYVDHIVIGYDYLNNLAGGWGPTYAAGTTVQGSTNGSTWTDVGTTPAYTDTTSTNGLVSIPVYDSYRYIRLFRPGGPGLYIALTEFQIWVR